MSSSTSSSTPTTYRPLPTRPFQQQPQQHPPQPTCRNFHSMYSYKSPFMSQITRFTFSSPDYAYIQLELVKSSQDHVEIDLIGWKVLLTKGMSQFLGATGESIPTDIIHIQNPPLPTTTQPVNTPSSRHQRHRRRHSYQHHTQFSNIETTSSRARRNSFSIDETSSQQTSVKSPQVWIRVPETDLTTVWTALSGFTTSLDTGNYGVIDAGIRVVRATRSLMSITGPLRSKW